MLAYVSRPMVGALFAALLFPSLAQAHGIMGDRFFPATITSDDPFAADELALPTATLLDHETDAHFEWSKTIVKGLSISFGGGYVDQRGGPSGFENFEITPTWQFLNDPDAEFVASAAFSVEIGGSGSKTIADRFSTATAKILFGKGFGTLPDSLALLQPFAITGVVGYAMPADNAASKSVQWSGALEYSLLYLQTNVRDQGFSQFVLRLTPVVEFAFQTPTDAGGGGTTGTINPGLIWSGQYEQVAVEAIVPVNRASGNTVGVIAQLHFYLDDIFPHSLGTPIFASDR